ncbi:MAG: hypothetical protein ACJ8LM_03885, partial [Candidatus Udaeobacter sp.]
DSEECPHSFQTIRPEARKVRPFPSLLRSHDLKAKADSRMLPLGRERYSTSLGSNAFFKLSGRKRLLRPEIRLLTIHVRKDLLTKRKEVCLPATAFPAG